MTREFANARSASANMRLNNPPKPLLLEIMTSMYIDGIGNRECELSPRSGGVGGKHEWVGGVLRGWVDGRSGDVKKKYRYAVGDE